VTGSTRHRLAVIASAHTDHALLLYSCLFTVQVPSTNTALRGQSDTGNCAATFDSDCNSALEDAASGFVYNMVENATPPPNSNLTAGSQSTVCYKAGQTLQDNFPSECQKYFNGTAQVTGSALTSSGQGPNQQLGGCLLVCNYREERYGIIWLTIGHSTD
jgi:hypothetical protein